MLQIFWWTYFLLMVRNDSRNIKEARDFFNFFLIKNISGARLMLVISTQSFSVRHNTLKKESLIKDINNFLCKYLHEF